MLGLSSLFANVLFNGFAIATIADRANVVAIGPELSTPELRAHLGKLEAGLGGKTFDESDDLSTGVFWKELAEDVDVILVKSDVMNIDSEAFLESLEHVFDCVDHLGFQDSSAILDRELDVVVALGDIVVPAPEVSFDIWHGRLLYLLIVCVLEGSCATPLG